jgi:hypothetical protein
VTNRRLAARTFQSVDATKQLRESQGHRSMRDRKGDSRQGPGKRTKGPFDGYSRGMGWDVAILLILGISLALASAAWFLVGLLLNAPQPAASTLDRPGVIVSPTSKYKAVPMSYLSPSVRANDNRLPFVN